VDDVSFDVSPGAIHALIGPNGAGKTTIFNMIAGVFKPDTGLILLDGRPLVGLRPDEICRAGVGRTFQNVRPFHGLSCEENVAIGALSWTDDLGEARDHAVGVLQLLGLEAAPSTAGSQFFMIMPFGTYTAPKRLTGLAAVLPTAVSAGTIPSSRGNANVTPRPRSTVRRDIFFLVIIMSCRRGPSPRSSPLRARGLDAPLRSRL
jgi:hypothetical protein